MRFTSTVIIKHLVLVAVLLLVMVIGASAFDGNRKGFVLGASFGYAPQTKWRPAVKKISEENPAYGMGIKIGTGLNDKNMLILAVETFRHQPAYLQDTVLIQGFFGPVLRHYFSENSMSLYVSAGGGMIGMTTESRRVGGRGLAYRIGVGYTFYRHISASVVYVRGTTSDNIDYWNSILAFRVNVLGY